MAETIRDVTAPSATTVAGPGVPGGAGAVTAPGATGGPPPASGTVATPALELRDVRVALGGRTVLDGVTLDVAPGEWLAVVGPNGAGKTTLLRAVCGLVPATGDVRVDGRSTRRLSRRERARRVAWLPQSPVLPAATSVARYVLLGRTAHLGTFATEGPDDLAAAAAAIERLDLAGFVDRPVTELSGGEQQRVALARLLAQGAPLALLDEPTSSLDVGQQQRVLELVDGMRRSEGLTVVSTLHDLTVVGQYADRIALVAGGRLAVVGTPAEVLDPDVLSAHYGAAVTVLQGPDGPVVVGSRTRGDRP